MILCIAGEDDSQLHTIPQEIVELIDSYQLETFITKVSYCVCVVHFILLVDLDMYFVIVGGSAFDNFFSLTLGM